MPLVAEPPVKQTNNALASAMSSWMESVGQFQVTGESGAQSAPAPAAPVAIAPAGTPPPAPAPAPAPEVEPVTPPAPVKPEPPAEPENGEKWPRTSADWKKFKEARETEKKEYQAKLDTYEKQLAELKTKPAAPADYEQVKKQAEDYSKVIQQISVENHPQFKAYYENATNNQIELAKQIVGADNAAQVTDIFSMPDGKAKDAQIDEVFSNLTPSQQARLGGVINQLTAIQQERAREIAKSKDTFAALQKQKQAEVETQQQNFKNQFEKTAKVMQSESPMFQKREGDEAWNTEVEQRLKAANDLLFSNLPPEKIMKAAFDAAALPTALKQNLALLEKVSSLEEQVKKLSAASPRVGGDRQPAPTAEAPAPARAPSGARPMDVLAGGWMKNLPSLGQG